MESSRCKSGLAKAVASRPVASVAICRATGRCEAYTARKQAVRIQLRHLSSLRCRRRHPSGRQHPCKRLGELVSESPEFLARGMLSKGFPANTGELAISREDGSVRPTQRHQVPGARGPLHGKRTTLNAEKPVAKGDQRRQLRVDEQSYEPMVPMKVEKRRAPARGGHAIQWRDGANRWTYRRSAPYSRRRTR